MSEAQQDQKPKYPPWLIEMLQSFLDMRDAQKEYFASPQDYKLKVAKVKETKVDEWLTKFVKNGYIKPRDKPTNQQPSLFNST